MPAQRACMKAVDTEAGSAHPSRPQPAARGLKLRLMLCWTKCAGIWADGALLAVWTSETSRSSTSWGGLWMTQRWWTA